ncbi:hypothetical protein HQQ81_13230 [Microbacteriaceae bacterium VKM Ac-2854]|nr:hypothetical protein [Microbacteriaceae bacterium VKM Ac-2854]
MAKVRSIQYGSQSVKPHTTEVDCFVQEVDAPDGSKIVHISTFGSDERKSKPKSSQTIQLDRMMALELVAYLQHAFPTR